MIQEILFSAGAAFCYFATGIACAVYAGAWGGPPDGCSDNDDDPCDSRPLTATNALQVVSWCKIYICSNNNYDFLLTQNTSYQEHMSCPNGGKKRLTLHHVERHLQIFSNFCKRTFRDRISPLRKALTAFKIKHY